MKALLTIPALAILTACGQPAEIVARDSLNFCATAIGYDMTQGTAERIAGLDCAHSESIYRRNAQSAPANIALSGAVAAAAGYAVATAPTTSTIIHKAAK